MESPRTYRANAIVLRRRNIGETDRILTLFTREKGKLSAVARGARKHMSKLAGCTELFTFGRYFLASGRNLDVITQSEIKESFPGIRKDLERIANANYFVELINALVEERDPNCDLFDTLLSALYLLESEVNPDVVARYFDLQAMSQLGYRPELEVCLRCHNSEFHQEFIFSPSLGGAVCEKCGVLPDDVIHLSSETTEILKRLAIAEPRELRNIQFTANVKKEISRAIRWYVRFRLDKDLKSPEFIHALASKEKGL